MTCVYKVAKERILYFLTITFLPQRSKCEKHSTMKMITASSQRTKQFKFLWRKLIVRIFDILDHLLFHVCHSCLSFSKIKFNHKPPMFSSSILVFFHQNNLKFQIDKYEFRISFYCKFNGYWTQYRKLFGKYTTE